MKTAPLLCLLLLVGCSSDFSKTYTRALLADAGVKMTLDCYRGSTVRIAACVVEGTAAERRELFSTLKLKPSTELQPGFEAAEACGQFPGFVLPAPTAAGNAPLAPGATLYTVGVPHPPGTSLGPVYLNAGGDRVCLTFKGGES